MNRGNLKIKTLSFFVFWVLFTACANSRAKSDAPLPVDDLYRDGLVLEVHAASHEYRQYVATLRQKGNFFVAEHFPLAPASPNIAAEFAKLKRHDKIKVKGEIVNPRNPQRHIRVTSLELVQPYEVEMPEHNYDLRLPQDLKPNGTIKALVHAIADEGRVLVLEYRGAVLPVVIRNPALTKGLYRNDTIQLKYLFENRPGRPPHLVLNSNTKEPLKVLYRIVSEHGKSGIRTGNLVMFPKSPQVQFNVFALEATNRFGLKHNYTLVNFDNSDEFAKIRKKLQDAWDSAPQDRVFNARNRLQNPRITVKAKGILNEVDPAQANPQILLKSADDLQITIQ